ncbi:general secretion pathway protein GspK [Hyphomicrobium facile]|uniref:General secretion pathway protein K n=1 Tax=Hyphomicrobium facile TaxID=51670 RepID=A0A1I7NQV0_9HYPH|nr:type II secretion system protein GspK [Hyphomicrobium facile]SFV36970.1 general secretion pathway protein K [Hyphomicrobium facile]
MGSTQMRPDRHDEGGFILVVVLAMCILLGLVAAVFSRAVQSYLREASGIAHSAQAEFAADAGVNIAALELATERDTGRTRRFPIDGAEWACHTDEGAELVIAVQEAGGKINLNLADDQLLSALFIGLGATPVAATLYADRIIDFRDRDDDRRINGAERDEYLAAGGTWGPKNTAFDSREELHQVLGLDPKMIEAIWPYVTLYSGTAGLDPETTSARLADIVTRGYGQLPHADVSSLAQGRLPSEFIVASGRHFFEITVAARLDGGATFVREAGFEIPTGKGAMPVFKIWNRARGTSQQRQWPSIVGLPRC